VCWTWMLNRSQVRHLYYMFCVQLRYSPEAETVLYVQASATACTQLVLLDSDVAQIIGVKCACRCDAVLALRVQTDF
jgi:hypothetical protein